jgi:isoleucyl-tRNA synthetase
MSEKEQKNPFQDSLNLPKTDFSIRANAQEKEPEILQRWEAQALAQATTIKNKGKKKFILHDGPPYANGHLHIGHALTYILKDAVCKYKRMLGFHAPLKPGWDCHGLPIELKVTAQLGIEQKRDSVDRLEFKKACREYANGWIKIQDQELKDMGKLADYEHPYITMNPGYEASTLRALAMFMEKGHIERKGKTVPWCGSCQTVLATAEIEYKDRKDPSCYILFPLEREAAKLVFPFSFEKNPDIDINFLVWTTTPWTIPLNRAVVLNPEAVYVLLQSKEPNQAFIVAKELADKVCATIGIEKVILAECDSIVFTGKKAQHPIIQDLQVPVLLDDSVIVGEGTACMHSAPGCGPEDYLLGIKNNLEIYSPLSADGKYTVEIKPEELVGMPIVDGQIWVIKKLAHTGKLLHKASINHSYPHCWRCHNAKK